MLCAIFTWHMVRWCNPLWTETNWRWEWKLSKRFSFKIVRHFFFFSKALNRHDLILCAAVFFSLFLILFSNQSEIYLFIKGTRLDLLRNKISKEKKSDEVFFFRRFEFIENTSIGSVNNGKWQRRKRMKRTKKRWQKLNAFNLKAERRKIHLNMNRNGFLKKFPSSISIVYVLSFASMHSVQRLEGFRWRFTFFEFSFFLAAHMWDMMSDYVQTV